MRSLTGALIATLLALVLMGGPALSAKVIELWKVRKGQPTETTPPPTRTTEGQPSAGIETQPPAAETQPPADDEQPTEAADTPQAHLADILRRAGARSGLTLSGDVMTLSAHDLKPPAAPVEGQPGETTEASVDEAAADAAPPTALLPSPLSDEPVTDYDVVALAAAEFSHPKGQTIRAAIVQTSAATDAWGLFSRNRGPESLTGLGQAASFGRGLRIWKGRYAILLSPNPPDPAMDRIRLTKLGRDITSQLSGAGSPPVMAGWLPTGYQLAHTLIYFHANGPISPESLGLGPQTEGVAAEYQVGENVHGGLVVRYPDEQAALAGWAAFVKSRMGGDPSSGTPGTRRVMPQNNRWNGVLARGRVCAFVVGAASRNQAEVFLAQAIGRAGG